MFGAISYQRELITAFGHVKAEGFVDPVSQLHLQKGGDSLSTFSLIAGFNLNKQYKLVLASRNGKALKSDSSYSFNTLLAVYNRNKFDLFGGIGGYRATEHKTKPTLVAGLKWTFKKGMGL